MRALPLAAVLLLTLAGSARADDDGDATPVAPLPRWSMGLYGGGGFTWLGPVSVGGPGGSMDLARGRGRWQYFGQGAVQRLLGEDTRGIEARLGGGVRWIGRSFQPDYSAAIEVYLQAALGYEWFRWDLGGKLGRPDASFGWGTQVRKLEEGGKRWIIRFGLEMTLAPSPDSDVIARMVCRGDCGDAPPDRPIDAGFLFVVGASWDP